MPFRTAISGLNASSAELRVIGNNVANASTTGFKKSRAEFSDIFASSSLGVTANAIGTGVKLAAVSQQFTQGNIEFTDNTLDLATSGQGFFRLNDGGVNVYSRAGAFGVDRQGFIVNNQSQRLTGFLADVNGNITGALGDLQLNTANIAPRATTQVTYQLNLDAADVIPGGATATSSVTFSAGNVIDDAVQVNTAAIPGAAPAASYDLLQNTTVRDEYGIAHTLNVYFDNPTTGDNLATMYVGIDGGNVVSATGTVIDFSGATPVPSTPSFGISLAGGLNPLNVTVDVSAVTLGAPAALTTTADGAVQSPFDVNNASTFNDSTSLTVFDSLGASHLLTTYYQKANGPNQWNTYAFVDGVQVDGPDTLAFSSTGVLTSPAAPATITVPTFNPGGGAANLSLALNVAGLTQFGSTFNVNSLVQDGFTTGRLSGIDTSETGIITARFTNGQSRTLAQVALADFSNSQGLRQLGDTTWAETFESGAALVGAAGSGSLGLIQAGALEGSNVDLTEQLVGLITAQRNFQANAQVITTADAVTQTIINIR